jgi:hypothetical protein
MEDPVALKVDTVTNAIDSLETAVDFLSRNDEMKWKWVAFALHHSLYSFCVAALHNGSWTDVITSGKDDKGFYAKVGDGGWRRSKREYVNGGPAYRIHWDSISGDPPQAQPSARKKKRPDRPSQSKLIGFWTALARVQDGYLWMGRMVTTQPLLLSDDEIDNIAWLTNEVRNNLTHFVPKLHLIDIASIKATGSTVIDAIEFLALESYAVMYRSGDMRSRVERAIKVIRQELNT